MSLSTEEFQRIAAAAAPTRSGAPATAPETLEEQQVPTALIPRRNPLYRDPIERYAERHAAQEALRYDQVVFQAEAEASAAERERELTPQFLTEAGSATMLPAPRKTSRDVLPDAKEHWAELLPVVGIVPSLVQTYKDFRLARRVVDGRATPEEEEEFNNMLVERSRDRSTAYSIFTGAIWSIPFAIEFASGSGVLRGAASTVLTKGGIKTFKAASDDLARMATRAAEKGVVGVAAGAARTAVRSGADDLVEAASRTAVRSGADDLVEAAAKVSTQAGEPIEVVVEGGKSLKTLQTAQRIAAVQRDTYSAANRGAVAKATQRGIGPAETFGRGIGYVLPAAKPGTRYARAAEWFAKGGALGEYGAADAAYRLADDAMDAVGKSGSGLTDEVVENLAKTHGDAAVKEFLTKVGIEGNRATAAVFAQKATPVLDAARRNLVKAGFTTAGKGLLYEGPVRTVALRPLQVANATVERMTPEFQLTEDEHGILHRVLVNNGDKIGGAALKAFGSEWIEQGSELSGQMISSLGYMVGPLVSKQLLAAGHISAILDKAKQNGTLRATRAFLFGLPGEQGLLAKMGWDGQIGENFEEIWGDLLRGVFGLQPGDDPYRKFADPQEQLIRAASFLVNPQGVYAYTKDSLFKQQRLLVDQVNRAADKLYLAAYTPEALADNKLRGAASLEEHGQAIIDVAREYHRLMVEKEAHRNQVGFAGIMNRAWDTIYRNRVAKSVAEAAEARMQVKLDGLENRLSADGFFSVNRTTLLSASDAALKEKGESLIVLALANEFPTLARTKKAREALSAVGMRHTLIDNPYGGGNIAAGYSETDVETIEDETKVPPEHIRVGDKKYVSRNKLLPLLETIRNRYMVDPKLINAQEASLLLQDRLGLLATMLPAARYGEEKDLAEAITVTPTMFERAWTALSDDQRVHFARIFTYGDSLEERLNNAEAHYRRVQAYIKSLTREDSSTPIELRMAPSRIFYGTAAEITTAFPGSSVGSATPQLPGHMFPDAQPRYLVSANGGVQLARAEEGGGHKVVVTINIDAPRHALAEETLHAALARLRKSNPQQYRSFLLRTVGDDGFQTQLKAFITRVSAKLPNVSEDDRREALAAAKELLRLVGRPEGTERMARGEAAQLERSWEGRAEEALVKLFKVHRTGFHQIRRADSSGRVGVLASSSVEVASDGFLLNTRLMEEVLKYNLLSVKTSELLDKTFNEIFNEAPGLRDALLAVIPREPGVAKWNYLQGSNLITPSSGYEQLATRVTQVRTRIEALNSLLDAGTAADRTGVARQLRALQQEEITLQAALEKLGHSLVGPQIPAAGAPAPAPGQMQVPGAIPPGSLGPDVSPPHELDSLRVRPSDIIDASRDALVEKFVAGLGKVPDAEKEEAKIAAQIYLDHPEFTVEKLTEEFTKARRMGSSGATRVFHALAMPRNFGKAQREDGWLIPATPEQVAVVAQLTGLADSTRIREQHSEAGVYGHTTVMAALTDSQGDRPYRYEEPANPADAANQLKRRAAGDRNDVVGRFVLDGRGWDAAGIRAALEDRGEGEEANRPGNLAYMREMALLRMALLSTGLIPVTTKLRFYGKLNDADTFTTSAEPDIIVVRPDGSNDFIDLKTHSAADLDPGWTIDSYAKDYTHGGVTRAGYKASHQIQLLMQKILAEKNAIRVNGLYILEVGNNLSTHESHVQSHINEAMEARLLWAHNVRGSEVELLQDTFLRPMSMQATEENGAKAFRVQYLDTPVSTVLPKEDEDRVQAYLTKVSEAAAVAEAAAASHDTGAEGAQLSDDALFKAFASPVQHSVDVVDPATPSASTLALAHPAQLRRRLLSMPQLDEALKLLPGGTHRSVLGEVQALLQAEQLGTILDEAAAERPAPELREFKVFAEAVEDALGALSHELSEQLRSAPDPETADLISTAGRQLAELIKEFRDSAERVSSAELPSMHEALMAINPDAAKVWEGIVEAVFRGRVRGAGTALKSGEVFQITPANVEEVFAALTATRFRLAAAYVKYNDDQRQAVAGSMETLVRLHTSILDMLEPMVTSGTPDYGGAEAEDFEELRASMDGDKEQVHGSKEFVESLASSGSVNRLRRILASVLTYHSNRDFNSDAETRALSIMIRHYARVNYDPGTNKHTYQAVGESPANEIMLALQSPDAMAAYLGGTDNYEAERRDLEALLNAGNTLHGSKLEAALATPLFRTAMRLTAITGPNFSLRTMFSSDAQARDFLTKHYGPSTPMKKVSVNGKDFQLEVPAISYDQVFDALLSLAGQHLRPQLAIRLGIDPDSKAILSELRVLNAEQAGRDLVQGILGWLSDEQKFSLPKLIDAVQNFTTVCDSDGRVIDEPDIHDRSTRAEFLSQVLGLDRKLLDEIELDNPDLLSEFAPQGGFIIRVKSNNAFDIPWASWQGAERNDAGIYVPRDHMDREPGSEAARRWTPPRYDGVVDRWFPTRDAAAAFAETAPWFTSAYTQRSFAPGLQTTIYQASNQAHELGYAVRCYSLGIFARMLETVVADADILQRTPDEQERAARAQLLNSQHMAAIRSQLRAQLLSRRMGVSKATILANAYARLLTGEDALAARYRNVDGNNASGLVGSQDVDRAMQPLLDHLSKLYGYPVQLANLVGAEFSWVKKGRMQGVAGAATKENLSHMDIVQVQAALFNNPERITTSEGQEIEVYWHILGQFGERDDLYAIPVPKFHGTVEILENYRAVLENRFLGFESNHAVAYDKLSAGGKHRIASVEALARELGVDASTSAEPGGPATATAQPTVTLASLRKNAQRTQAATDRQVSADTLFQNPEFIGNEYLYNGLFLMNGVGGVESYKNWETFVKRATTLTTPGIHGHLEVMRGSMRDPSSTAQQDHCNLVVIEIDPDSGFDLPKRYDGLTFFTGAFNERTLTPGFGAKRAEGSVKRRHRGTPRRRGFECMKGLISDASHESGNRLQVKSNMLNLDVANPVMNPKVFAGTMYEKLFNLAQEVLANASTTSYRDQAHILTFTSSAKNYPKGKGTKVKFSDDGTKLVLVDSAPTKIPVPFETLTMVQDLRRDATAVPRMIGIQMLANFASMSPEALDIVAEHQDAMLQHFKAAYTDKAFSEDAETRRAFLGSLLDRRRNPDLFQSLVVEAANPRDCPRLLGALSPIIASAAAKEALRVVAARAELQELPAADIKLRGLVTVRQNEAGAWVATEHADPAAVVQVPDVIVSGTAEDGRPYREEQEAPFVNLALVYNAFVKPANPVALTDKPSRDDFQRVMTFFLNNKASVEALADPAVAKDVATRVTAALSPALLHEYLRQPAVGYEDLKLNGIEWQSVYLSETGSVVVRGELTSFYRVPSSGAPSHTFARVKHVLKGVSANLIITDYQTQLNAGADNDGDARYLMPLELELQHKPKDSLGNRLWREYQKAYMNPRNTPLFQRSIAGMVAAVQERAHTLTINRKKQEGALAASARIERPWNDPRRFLETRDINTIVAMLKGATTNCNSGIRALSQLGLALKPTTQGTERDETINFLDNDGTQRSIRLYRPRQALNDLGAAAFDTEANLLDILQAWQNIAFDGLTLGEWGPDSIGMNEVTVNAMVGMLILDPVLTERALAGEVYSADDALARATLVSEFMTSPEIRAFVQLRREEAGLLARMARTRPIDAHHATWRNERDQDDLATKVLNLATGLRDSPRTTGADRTKSLERLLTGMHEGLQRNLCLLFGETPYNDNNLSADIMTLVTSFYPLIKKTPMMSYVNFKRTQATLRRIASDKLSLFSTTPYIERTEQESPPAEEAERDPSRYLILGAGAPRHVNAILGPTREALQAKVAAHLQSVHEQTERQGKHLTLVVSIEAGPENSLSRMAETVAMEFAAQNPAVNLVLAPRYLDSDNASGSENLAAKQRLSGYVAQFAGPQATAKRAPGTSFQTLNPIVDDGEQVPRLFNGTGSVIGVVANKEAVPMSMRPFMSARANLLFTPGAAKPLSTIPSSMAVIPTTGLEALRRTQHSKPREVPFFQRRTAWDDLVFSETDLPGDVKGRGIARLAMNSVRLAGQGWYHESILETDAMKEVMRQVANDPLNFEIDPDPVALATEMNPRPGAIWSILPEASSQEVLGQPADQRFLVDSGRSSATMMDQVLAGLGALAGKKASQAELQELRDTLVILADFGDRDQLASNLDVLKGWCAVGHIHNRYFLFYRGKSGNLEADAVTSIYPFARNPLLTDRVGPTNHDFERVADSAISAHAAQIFRTDSSLNDMYRALLDLHGLREYLAGELRSQRLDIGIDPAEIERELFSDDALMHAAGYLLMELEYSANVMGITLPKALQLLSVAATTFRAFLPSDSTKNTLFAPLAFDDYMGTKFMPNLTQAFLDSGNAMRSWVASNPVRTIVDGVDFSSQLHPQYVEAQRLKLEAMAFASDTNDPGIAEGAARVRLITYLMSFTGLLRDGTMPRATSAAYWNGPIHASLIQACLVKTAKALRGDTDKSDLIKAMVAGAFAAHSRFHHEAAKASMLEAVSANLNSHALQELVSEARAPGSEPSIQPDSDPAMTSVDLYYTYNAAYRGADADSLHRAYRDATHHAAEIQNFGNVNSDNILRLAGIIADRRVTYSQGADGLWEVRDPLKSPGAVPNSNAFGELVDRYKSERAARSHAARLNRQRNHRITTADKTRGEKAMALAIQFIENPTLLNDRAAWRESFIFTGRVKRDRDGNKLVTHSEEDGGASYFVPEFYDENIEAFIQEFGEARMMALIEGVRKGFADGLAYVNKYMANTVDRSLYITQRLDYILHLYLSLNPAMARSEFETDKNLRQQSERQGQAAPRTYITYLEAAILRGREAKTLNAAELVRLWHESVLRSAKATQVIAEGIQTVHWSGKPLWVPVFAYNGTRESFIERLRQMKKTDAEINEALRFETGISDTAARTLLDNLVRSINAYISGLPAHNRPLLIAPIDAAADPRLMVNSVVHQYETVLRHMGYSVLTKDVSRFSPISSWLVLTHPEANGPRDNTARNLLLSLENRRWGGMTVRVLEDIRSWMKWGSLNLSFFHGFSLLESAIATTGITHGGLNYILPWRWLGQWRELRNEITKARVDPEYAGKWSRAGMGLDFSNNPDYFSNRVLWQLDYFTRETILGRLPGIHQAARALLYLGRLNDRLLWREWMPSLKLSAAESMRLRYKQEFAEYHGREMFPDEEANLLSDIAMYVNKAFGGLDWTQFTWVTPRRMQLLHWCFFAPDWTLSSLLIAGAGDMPGIKHAIKEQTSNLARFEQITVYWPAMILLVQTLIPDVLQALIKALFGMDDDEMSWSPGGNEYGKQGLAGTGGHIDVTPLARKIGLLGLMRWEGGPTGQRRVYTRWAKQSTEVWEGWMQSPMETFFGKTSPMVKMAYELAFAENFMDWDMDFKDEGLSGWVKGRNKGFMGSRLWNIAEKFVPMSLTSLLQGRPTNFFSPMSQGMSLYSAQKTYAKVLASYADRAIAGEARRNPTVYHNLEAIGDEILDAAVRNGYDRDSVIKGAHRGVMSEIYGKFAEAVRDCDSEAIEEQAAKLIRMNGTPKRAIASAKAKFKGLGRTLKPEELEAILSAFSRTDPDAKK